MGLIDHMAGRRTYLDANVLIYVLEGHATYAPLLQPMLDAISQGMAHVVTSELTLAEMLVAPLRQGLDDQARTYQHYLRPRPHFDVVPISRPVLVHAARLRARSSLKLPDAIHVATAWQSTCDLFLTNDTGIKDLESLDVLRLADVTP